MKDIIVIGAGGHCRSALSIIKLQSLYRPIAILDYNTHSDEFINGIPVLPIQHMMDLGCLDVFMAIGDNSKREKSIQEMRCHGFSFPNVISPNAFVDPTSVLGIGIFIGNNVHIGPHASIGSFTIVNTSSVIEHESEIGMFSQICPGSIICGRSHISDYCFLGANSVIRDKLHIADHTTIGAGACVVKSIISPHGTYVGVPAKSL